MHANDQSPESRRSARRAVDLSCEVITNRWDRPVHSHCADLSELGMLLETTFPLEHGDDVVLSFKTPHFDEEITVFATVRYIRRADSDAESREHDVGLEFSGMSLREHLLLAAALRGMPPSLPKQRVWS